MNPIKRTVQYLRTVRSFQEEALWSDVWHDTIRGIGWAKDLPSLSPGRTAVGYNYLYVMTRILNEMRPHRVLDIGLGISSTLVSEYFYSVQTEGAEHLIIEHDKDWISFYEANHPLSSYSRIIRQDLAIKKKDGEEYIAYRDISDIIQGKRFSVVSVDAPFGSYPNDVGWSQGEPKYARRDIIEYIPEILEESFVIIIDDYNRRGEQRTVQDIKEKLKEIKTYGGVYRGRSDVYVLVSEDNRFLCSL